MSDVLLERDSRGRVALGKLGRDNDRFLASVDDDGTITLIPVAVIPLHELALLRNPEALERINAALTDPALGHKRHWAGETP